MAKVRKSNCAGMTMVELLVAIAILLILSLLVFTGMPKLNASADHAKCTSNLRQLSVGLNNYMADFGGIYPSRFWSRSSPEGILNHVGIPDQNVLLDTIFTCPAMQKNSQLRSVDLLHRTYAMNLYATTERQSSGANVRRVNVLKPAEMMVITEGRISGPIVDAKGNQGKQYLTTTRAEHMLGEGGWNYPHGGLQNTLFMDGSIRQISRKDAAEIGGNQLFWLGY